MDAWRVRPLQSGWPALHAPVAAVETRAQVEHHVIVRIKLVKVRAEEDVPALTRLPYEEGTVQMRGQICHIRKVRASHLNTDRNAYVAPHVPRSGKSIGVACSAAKSRRSIGWPIVTIRGDVTPAWANVRALNEEGSHISSAHLLHCRERGPTA